MKLRPGVTFFPLNDDLVVFNEASQSLIGLNATAALIVQKMREGVPASELVGALVSERGVAVDEAAGWVASALEALGFQGLLTDSQMPAPFQRQTSATEAAIARAKSKLPPFRAFEPVVEGRYHLLGSHALIRYGHRAQKRMVNTVIGHLETEENTPPTLTIDIQGVHWDEGRQITSNIYCDGMPEAQAMRLSNLGPLVKSALWAAAVNAHDFLLDLHAGVVGRDGRCILLPAAAGSGKSSLTAALTYSGLDYYSDEVALIERETFQVSAVPLAVCIKSTGWDLMSRYYPELPTLPIHRRADGKLVRYISRRATVAHTEPARVSHIFFPLYSKDEPTKLTRVPRANALARLMDQCIASRLRLDPESAEALVGWIAGIDCYSLTFSSLDEAVKLVNSMAYPE